MTGDGLVDPIYRFNIITSSFAQLVDYDGSTESVRLRAKYVAQKSNYLLLINTLDLTDGTTYYPSRVYYSLLNSTINANAISSYSWNRYVDVRTNDGEELTGAEVIFDNVLLPKQSSIHEFSFSVLRPNTGDQALKELVSGFGVLAPKSFVNTGQFVFFASQDGIRIYDGGRRSRLNVSEESRVIKIGRAHV